MKLTESNKFMFETRVIPEVPVDSARKANLNLD